MSGVLKLADFPAAIAEQEKLGLRPGALWAGLTIFVQIAGSLLVITRRYVWLGAGALDVFTAVAAVLAHGAPAASDLTTKASVAAARLIGDFCTVSKKESDYDQ